MSKTKEEVLETPPGAAEPAADKDPKAAPEADIEAAAVPDAADATEDAEEEPQLPPTPEEQIAQLTDAVAEAKDKHLRLRAELDNFRKRSQRDISSARIIGKTAAIESILPIV
ncbi:MAG TPA: nucleotide exchange factor GrpE, partial [Lentisphaeria bacterium]|nr:nucleotide exchange factor GrpE [Lentisphaeria bacterium]